MAVLHSEPVRFSDVGADGVVPDSVISTYLEQARLAWFEQTGASGEPGPLEHEVDLILARTELDVLDAVGYPATVEISVEVGRIGTKSFELEYELRVGERRVAEARTVLVGFDTTTRASTAIPEHWRVRLAAATDRPPWPRERAEP